MSKASSKNKKNLSSGRFTAEQVTKLVTFWQMHHKELDTDSEAGPKTRKSIDDADLSKQVISGKYSGDLGVFMVECIGQDRFKVTSGIKNDR
jgi:hypothetical protein